MVMVSSPTSISKTISSFSSTSVDSRSQHSLSSASEDKNEGECSAAESFLA